MSENQLKNIAKWLATASIAVLSAACGGAGSTSLGQQSAYVNHAATGNTQCIQPEKPIQFSARNVRTQRPVYPIDYGVDGGYIFAGRHPSPEELPKRKDILPDPHYAEWIGQVGTIHREILPVPSSVPTVQLSTARKLMDGMSPPDGRIVVQLFQGNANVALTISQEKFDRDLRDSVALHANQPGVDCLEVIGFAFDIRKIDPRFDEFNDGEYTLYNGTLYFKLNGTLRSVAF